MERTNTILSSSFRVLQRRCYFFSLPTPLRNVIAAIFILVLVMPVHTQEDFYRQGHFAERAGHRPVTVGNFVFVYCAAAVAEYAGLSSLYRYNESGNCVRFLHDKYIWNAQATLDEKLIVISQERRCSWKLDTLSYFIEKLDIDGSVMASLPIDGGSAVFLQTADSGFVVFLWDNKTMLRLDKNLQLLSKSIHSFGIAQVGTVCSNGKIALAHLTSTDQKLSLLNSAGQVLSSVNIDFFPMHLKTMGNDRILAYAAKVFYQFDYNLAPVQSFSVNQVYDYFSRNDSVYALVRDSAGPLVVYAVYNKNMKIVFKTALSNYFAVSFCAYKNRVAILFDPDVISYGWLGHCLTVIPKLSTFGPTKSMWLNQASIDSAYVLPRADGFYDIYARLRFTVSNWKAPVTKFSITYELAPDIVCGKHYATQEFNEYVPQFEDFSSQSAGFLKTRGKLYNGVITATYCVVLNQPDGEFDATPGDNVYCLVPQFLPTTLQQIEKDQTALTVFPNPAETNITVAAGTMMQRIEVFNFQGQVLRMYIVDENRKELELSDLPRGLYFLRVQLADQTVTRRFCLK